MSDPTDISAGNVTGASPVAPRPIETIALARRTLLDLAARESGGLPDDLNEPYHEWLQGLPLPEPGATVDPVLHLGVALTPGRSAAGGFERRVFTAGALVAPMIGPTADFLGDAGATADEVERIGDLGPVVRPDLLSSWWMVREHAHDVGWTMHGQLDPHAVARAIDLEEHRQALLALTDDEPGVHVVAIGRSTGAGEPVAQLRLLVDDPEDDGAVAAATRCLAAFDAPLPDDDTLARALALSEGCPVGVVLWLLPDGLARAGLTFGAADDALVVALADHEGWTDRLDTIAASRAALAGDGGETTLTVELFTDADGGGTTLHVDAFRG